MSRGAVCACVWGGVSGSSSRCIFVSCMQLVAVLNTAFCMTFILLMLVDDARVDHMEETYNRAGLMTALFSLCCCSE